MIDTAELRAAERRLARRDRRLARVIAANGPCTLGARPRDPFHVLCSSIIGQQLSAKAADTIQARVHALTGVQDQLLPELLLAVTPQQLRGAGLSNAKAKWLHGLSEHTRSGTFSFAELGEMEDEAAIAALDALPGIGRWTAEMFLIFALDRTDIFSLGDAGLRRSVNLLYNKGEKLDDEATLAITQRWAPHRSIASWHLWRLVDAEITAWN